ncbi:hypothetical protein F2P81_005220 [Scophthalmus maximus]|uniref:Uncharacterized protein n=1 Tax=Scophthalmus maximus TaxID=52904 RepID=A0A6A4TB88_SCOMX|nr:hypothetical protein F2P81_005220 [Scophthalmus maximus]
MKRKRVFSPDLLLQSPPAARNKPHRDSCSRNRSAAPRPHALAIAWSGITARRQSHVFFTGPRNERDEPTVLLNIAPSI